ncbi:MAG: efflux transporter outer membrane subunit [Deltaproteobacteria bacterium]|jgi:multidrug efflux system outer membrane protein|nr:efflux transporter outer membrane subunit [Deltaproteobacteria bacterium]
MPAVNKTFFCLWLLLLTGACTLAPVYERPDAPVPGSFPEYPVFQGVGQDSETENPDKAASAAEIAARTKVMEDAGASWKDNTATPGAAAIDQSARDKAWTVPETARTGELPDASSPAETSPPDAAPPESIQTSDAGRPSADRILTAGDMEVEIDAIPGAGNITWKEFFSDSSMQRLIGLALENNRNLRMALLNIEKARAMYQIQRADLLPTIQAGAQSSNQRITAELSPVRQASISRQHSVSVGFTSFELDLFGRVRSLEDAALENFFALTQNAHSAQVSLIAEVASTYLTLASYNELYALTESAYQSRKTSYDLAKRLFEQGLASQLALNQAGAAMDQARVDAAQFRTASLRYANALSLLLGSPLPGDMVLPQRLADIESLKEVPEGLPSYLLERRPDILAAEHRLKSSNANIGAARASFFPRIGLTGSLGTISTEMSNLFENASRTWNFIPVVSLPIFDTGRLRANLRVSETERKLALAAYEESIQNAFREVADTLAFRSTSAEQIAAVTSFVHSAKQSYDLSNLRYEVGVDSFLNVLDSQRVYFSAQQAYVNTMLNNEINKLTLYKALGGGWE